MKHSIIMLALAAATLAPVSALAQTQEAAATSEAHYSVSTTKVATLLDDPAAAAVLAEIIPTVYANEMFQTMGRDQTLEAIQQYEPVALSDENLARIQAELDKLPPRE